MVDKDTFRKIEIVNNAFDCMGDEGIYEDRVVQGCHNSLFW